MNKTCRMDADDFTCPDCGSDSRPIVDRSYENADADGNRGIWITWVRCVDCDYEEGFHSY